MGNILVNILGSPVAPFSMSHTSVLCLSLIIALAHGATCPPLTPREAPLDARDLRIDDFSAIMAMGDSMTAGFNSAKANMHEYRGVSFSIGGDQGATTLPNLIQAVKGDTPLVGASLGELSKPTIKAPCSGPDVDNVCRLSAAVDGSDVQDLIDMQVGYLRDTINSAPWAANISIVRDWKLLTIFTGLDDVVFYNSTTQPPTKSSTPVDLFATNFDKLLTAIHEQLPKTFVNVVLLPEHFDPKVTTSRFSCKLFKWYSEYAGIHWTASSSWLQTIRTFNQVLTSVAAKWKLKQFNDFAVSLQPFNQHTNLTKADFDTADCFHPNLRAHQGMAVGLWNNMLAATDGEKKSSWDVADMPKCPTADSRLVV